MWEFLSFLDQGHLTGIISLVFLLLSSCWNIFSQYKVAPQKDSMDAHKTTWKQRLFLGLSKSRQQTWGKLLTLSSQKKLDSKTIEQIEELLYGADIGHDMVEELMSALKERVNNFQEEGPKGFFKNFLREKMEHIQSNLDPSLFHYTRGQGCKTFMIVGVNGVGKTTTVGKLSTKLAEQGAKVVVGACDTFRAAAVDQLQVWCDRAKVKMVRAKDGAKSSGVGYEALQTAVREKADYCLLDTAGRIHTAKDLMTELLKSKSVLGKLQKDAPNHTLLVLDAITGQNALKQAQEFHKVLGVTGLIFTKLDGSSRAGSAVSIVNNLKIPITYIGVGENLEDLNAFCLDDYLQALLKE